VSDVNIKWFIVCCEKTHRYNNLEQNQVSAPFMILLHIKAKV